MTDKPGFVRTILDALITGRQRAADRYVATYLRDDGLVPRDKR